MAFLCVFASIIWGANVIFMKALLTEVPPLLLAMLRVLLSSLVLFVFAKISHQSLKISFSQVFPLLVLALFNVTLNFGFSFIGMKQISGSQVALLNGLNPVLVLLTCPKQIDDKKKMKCAITLFGIWCSFHFQLSQFNLGHLFFVLSLASYTLSFVYGKKIKLSPLTKSFYAQLFGGMMLFLGNLYRQEMYLPTLSFMTWCLFLALSVFGFAFIQYVYFKASEIIGNPKTSFYMNLNPIFSYLGALIFLHEPFDWYQIGGMLCLLVGFLL